MRTCESMRSSVIGPRVVGAMWLLLVTLAWGCGDDTVSGNAGGGVGAQQDSGGGVLEDTATMGDVESADAGGVISDAGAGEDTAASEDGGVSSDADDGQGAGDIVGDAGAPLDCPGGVGCSCEGNDDCDTGVCVDMPGGKKCASLCTDTCPNGFSCENVSTGADKIFACVFKYLTLCSPCKEDADCKNMGVETFCVDYGADGSFCGGSCEDNGDCPEGYSCKDKQGTTGSSAKQCVLDKGVCPCSDWAIKSGHKTACSLKNEFGTCTADRICAKDGLSACTVKAAAPELCNALDDDCDGVTDNLAQDYKCSNKLFVDMGSKATCTGDEECKEADEKCDLVAGLCKQLAGECFGVPSCSPGGQLLCNQAKEPKFELCNGEDDDCDGSTDEGFVWEQADGKKLELGASCGLGECGGGNVVCEDLKKAVCNTASKSKSEECNNLDDDCNGVIDDEAVVCDDQDACTKNVCDSKESKCSNPVAVDCDDGEQCTKDSCDKTSGDCVNKALVGVSCDDGDACSVGDLCGDKAGKVVCLAGSVTKNCDDGNLCTDDGCDSKTGCVALPNAATQICYSGKPETLGKGECKSGMQLCKEGALGGTCVGEFTPNNTEICDKLDDDCNGVIDNGCAATLVRVSFSSSAGRIKGAKNVLRARLGGESNAGVAVGKKKTARFGFMAWLRSLL